MEQIKWDGSKSKMEEIDKIIAGFLFSIFVSRKHGFEIGC